MREIEQLKEDMILTIMNNHNLEIRIWHLEQPQHPQLNEIPKNHTITATISAKYHKN